MIAPRILLALTLLAGAVTACAPVPHPFSAHEGDNPLVDDRRVTSSVQVQAVPALPGLAEAIVHDLVLQDVLATTHDAGPRKVLVRGEPAEGGLTWHLVTPDGHELGSATQPLPRGADVAALARDATPLIIGLLTAGGAAPDLADRPHIAVHLVQGPATLRLRALSQAMADALVAQGIAVSNDHPVAVVDGAARVTPGGTGTDVLQVDWTVRDANGVSLGTVSQGSPVERKILAGPMTELARDIAGAAAPGVVAVIRQKLPGALRGG
jgi:hypothetical protein